MPNMATTLCRACNKDVTDIKYIKSAQGSIYCEECVGAAKEKAANARNQAAHAKQEPPDVPPTQRHLPDFCPNCDAPVLANRRLCFKCHRDVTQMDTIIAKKAREAKTSPVEVLGTWVGGLAKAGLIVFVVGVLALFGYGGWMLFHPPGAFDDFPTARSEAVKQILNDIAQGTDKGYANAFLLISTRIRNNNNSNENLRYKMVYTRMHDDFLSKYGPDWPSKAIIENEFPESTSPIVPFLVTLNHDEYHITSQAQMSLTSAVELTMTHDQFPEDGKHHFGVMDIQEYSLIPKTKQQIAFEQLIQNMRNQKKGN